MSFWKTLGAVFLGNKLSQSSTDSQRDRANRVFGVDKLIDNWARKNINSEIERIQTEAGYDKFGVPIDKRPFMIAWLLTEMKLCEAGTPRYFKDSPELLPYYISLYNKRGINIKKETYPTNLTKREQDQIDIGLGYGLIGQILDRPKPIRF